MAITVTNVSKRFGDYVALDRVSVDVASGSLTALLGPSGSGKSTLLRVIAGLEVADTGDVFISGKEATALAPQKRGVGFVFQHYAPFKHLTVWENVAFGLRVRKQPKQEIRARVEQAGPPHELYDHPANAFVMSFVGPVNRLGDSWVRPHDVELRLEPNGTTREAQVERLVHLGFEVRVELMRDDGERLSAQLSRTEAELLELERGQI